MRAVVTGASGFLGGRLTQMLAAQGAQVTILARATSDLRHLASFPVTVVRGDLSDSKSLISAAQNSTHIFHCAACSTDWAPRQTYIDANITGTQNVIAAALATPTLQRFIHVSTTDVYGYPEIPCSEDQPPVETALPYNQTKLRGERAVWQASFDHGLPVTILRPATIYGPRGKDFTLDMAALLRQRLMAYVDHGSATGGFTYVDNVAQAMISAATHPQTIGQAFNISDGTNASWKQYLTLFAQHLGTKPPWINLSFATAMSLAGLMETPHRLGLPGKPLLTRHAVYLLGRNQEFPIAKARATFGFTPAIGLDEGLRRSVAWLRA
ncbi:MAG: NAD-dependent epimerase/dehydratase family protein [Acidobacteria bacterium]|nr:NAD-dependent epimerase/dehydratase family protein [Acidobacteriota bacterium]